MTELMFLGRRNKKSGGGNCHLPAFSSPPTPPPLRKSSCRFSNIAWTQTEWTGLMRNSGETRCLFQTTFQSVDWDRQYRGGRRVHLGIYWRYFSMYNTSYKHWGVSALCTMFKEAYVANGHVNKNPMSKYGRAYLHGCLRLYVYIKQTRDSR